MVYLFKMVIFHGYATNNQRVEAKFMDFYTSLLFKKKNHVAKIMFYTFIQVAIK